MAGELELLKTTPEEDNAAKDEATKELSDNITGVLSTVASFKLTVIDGELLISAMLEGASEEDITAGDKATTDLSEDSE